MPTPQEIIEAWEAKHQIKLTEEQKTTLLAEVQKVPTPEDWTRFMAKEREVTQLDSSLKGREKSLAEREAEVKKHLEQIEAFKKDPIAAAEKMGLSYEEWTKRIIGDGQPDPIMQLTRQVEALAAQNKELQEALDGNQQTAKQRQEQEQIAASLRQFDGIIADKRFDVIRQYGSAYEKFAGQKLDPHEAAKAIALQHFQKHKDEIESGRMQELTLQEIADTMLSEAQARWDAIPEPAKKSLLEDPAQNPGNENQDQQQQQAGYNPDKFDVVPEDGQQESQESGSPRPQALTAADEQSSPPADFENMPWEKRLEYTKSHGLPQKFKE